MPAIKVQPCRLASGLPGSGADQALHYDAATYFSAVALMLKSTDKTPLVTAAQTVVNAAKRDRTVFFFGNGGSAATAVHWSSDVMRCSAAEGFQIKCMCLNGNLSVFSAIANDCGYERVFADQLKVLARSGDVLVAVSASGNSPNCVKALEYGKEIGTTNICLVGFDGGVMKGLSECCLHVNSRDYMLIEDVHMVASHTVSRMIASLYRAG